MPTTQNTAITENGAANDYLPTFAQKSDTDQQQMIDMLKQEITAASHHIKNHCDVTRPAADCDYCRGAGARD